VSEVLSVDLGGTNFRMAVISDSGEVLRSEKVPTAEVESIAEGLKTLIEKVDGQGVEDLVFGAPGVVDFETGTVLYAANLSEEHRKEINRSALEAAIGKRIFLVNDADLAAVGEAYLGAGKGLESVLYLTCSTGIGGGYVQHGKLYRSRYSGMEAGHTRLGLEPYDEAESLGSGTALARMASELGLSIDNPTLVSRASLAGGREREILEGAMEALGVLAANLAWLLAPDVIVVGGGLGLSSPLVLELANQAFGRAKPHYLAELTLVPALLGDDAGLRGAAFVEKALST
jgi:glucokinase